MSQTAPSSPDAPDTGDAITVLDRLSAAQRQRLAFIEFRVWFHGAVTRKQVLEQFDMATAAGTRDVMLYRKLAPQNVAYVQKSYRYQVTFHPLFDHPVDRVLTALTQGFGAGENPPLSDVLPHAAPARLNPPDLHTLATVTRAIAGKQVLRLTYHSMRTGAVVREIIPHALVDSGLRWHVRAFDRTKGGFRDLVLTRMEKVLRADTGPSGDAIPVQSHELASADTQWVRYVTLSLVPHPAHAHPSSIARDFAMKEGRLTVRLRAAMAGYVLRQWQVDCSPDARLRGREIRLRLADGDVLAEVGTAALAPGYVPEAPQASHAQVPHERPSAGGEEVRIRGDDLTRSRDR